MFVSSFLQELLNPGKSAGLLLVLFCVADRFFIIVESSETAVHRFAFPLSGLFLRLYGKVQPRL